MTYVEGDVISDVFWFDRNDVPDCRVKANWEPTFKYLLFISKLLKKHNILFLITFYPHGHQISEREWTKGRMAWGLSPNKTYSLAFFQPLRNFLNKNKIDYVDMTEDFNNSKEHKLFFDYDGHFTNKGHALAARLIYAKLKQMKMEP